MKDASVALFHGLRKMSIGKEIKYKRTLIELIEPSTDERAEEVLEKLRKELDGHEKALRECEADFNEAVEDYRK